MLALGTDLRNLRPLSDWPDGLVRGKQQLTLGFAPIRLSSRQMRRSAAEGGPVGLTIGSGWRIEYAIGAGGSATVFRAKRADGQLAAVKLMHHQLASAWTKRFEREAKLLQSLSHPAVPRLYEFGRMRGVPFLVLELLKGRPLDGVIRGPRSKESVSQILSYAIQALQALAAVHARGIVHRDLKPSNLFVTEAGVLKVLDFGAAIDVDMASISPDSLTSGLLGTPAYMAPEQARGRWDMVDCRSDIWSLGAVLFTLLSGEHVHRAQTSNEQLSLAMTRSARSLAAVTSDLDPGLVRVIDRALAYERADRFQSAEAFRQALLGATEQEIRSADDCRELTLRETTSVSSGTARSSKRSADWRRRGRKTVWVGGTCFGFSVLALAFVPAEPESPARVRKSVPEVEPTTGDVVVTSVRLSATASSNPTLVQVLPAQSAAGRRNTVRERVDSIPRPPRGPATASPRNPSHDPGPNVEERKPTSLVTAPLPPTQSALDRRLRTTGEGPNAADTRPRPRADLPAASPLDMRR